MIQGNNMKRIANWPAAFTQGLILKGAESLAAINKVYRHIDCSIVFNGISYVLKCRSLLKCSAELGLEYAVS